MVIRWMPPRKLLEGMYQAMVPVGDDQFASFYGDTVASLRRQIRNWRQFRTGGL